MCEFFECGFYGELLDFLEFCSNVDWSDTQEVKVFSREIHFLFVQVVKEAVHYWDGNEEGLGAQGLYNSEYLSHPVNHVCPILYIDFVAL